MTRLGLTIGAIFACVLVHAPWPASAATYARQTVVGTHVYTEEVYLTTGVVTFETVNLSGGGDTVMHLLNDDGDEVAHGDDYDLSLRSRIEYEVTQGGWFLLVVRAKDSRFSGTCDILKDLQPHQFDIPFGGTRIAAGTTSSDEIHTALINQGTDDTVLYGLDASGHLLDMDDDSGVGYAFRLSGAFDTVVVATYGWQEGETYVVINDAATDSDGDGLGQALETSLCLCNYSTDYSCNQYCLDVRNPQDSDGDGIGDDLELLGKEASGAALHLPRWGADPARKDVFIEVDRRREDPLNPHDDDTPRPHPELVLQPAADAYCSLEAPQDALLNRDTTNDIKLHFDTGDPSTSTLYGDWGGSQLVPHDADRSALQTDPEYFHPGRHGVFHYAVAVQGGGTTGNYPKPCPGASFSFNTYAPENLAHELGHNFDLRHGGSEMAVDQNSKPHYRSIMNYAFSYSLDSVAPAFSKGSFSSVVLNPANLCEAEGFKTGDKDPIAYLEEDPYGYKLEKIAGSSYWGIDWNRDGTVSACTAVTSRAAPNLGRPFAECTGVEPQPELGRYHWNWSRIGNALNLHFVPIDCDVSSTPSMTQGANALYLVYRAANGYLVLVHSDHDFKSTCTKPFSMNCTIWSQEILATATDPAGPAVVSYAHDGNDYLMVVYKAGGLWQYAVRKEPSLVVVDTGAISGTSDARFEPVLTIEGGKPWLLFRRGNNWNVASQLLGRHYAHGNGWSSQAGQQLAGNPATALIVYSVGAVATNPDGMHAVFTELVQQGSFPHALFWAKYTGNNTWTRITGSNIEKNGLQDATHVRRVGLAWIPFGGGLTGGRWYLAVNTNNTGKGGRGDVLLDITKGGAPGSPAASKWTGWRPYDNKWFATKSGVHLMGWPDAGYLRMAVVFHQSPPVLQFRPFADGILDIDLKDSDDWDMMAQGGICAGLWGCTHSFCTGGGGATTACVGRMP